MRWWSTAWCRPPPRPSSRRPEMPTRPRKRQTMNAMTFLQRSLGLATLALLGACAMPGKPASADGIVFADKDADLALYAGGPRPSWHVQVADYEASQPLTGSSLQIPKPPEPKVPRSQVGARVSARNGAGDALTLQWKEAWSAALRLEGGAPLDLRPYLATGTLEFDVNVVEMKEGGLSFKVACGPGCDRRVSWVGAARSAAGKGWQRLAFALSCFVREG